MLRRSKIPALVLAFCLLASLLLTAAARMRPPPPPPPPPSRPPRIPASPRKGRPNGPSCSIFAAQTWESGGGTATNNLAELQEAALTNNVNYIIQTGAQQSGKTASSPPTVCSAGR